MVEAPGIERRPTMAMRRRLGIVESGLSWLAELFAADGPGLQTCQGRSNGVQLQQLQQHALAPSGNALVGGTAVRPGDGAGEGQAALRARRGGPPGGFLGHRLQIHGQGQPPACRRSNPIRIALTDLDALMANQRPRVGPECVPTNRSFRRPGTVSAAEHQHSGARRRRGTWNGPSVGTPGPRPLRPVYQNPRRGPSENNRR